MKEANAPSALDLGSPGSLPARHTSPDLPRPTPQAAATVGRIRLPLLERWHLLSLDAPFVAVAWTWLLARCNGNPPGVGVLAAMFLAVWMLYAGDRILDAQAATRRESILEERHHFHARHRRWFLLGMLPAAVALAFLVLHFPPALRLNYLGLSALLWVWLAIVHLSSNAARLPKEIVVALIFAAAVLLPALTTTTHLPVAAIDFAALTAVLTMNGCFLAAWEGTAAAPSPTAFTQPAIDRLARHRSGLSITLAVVCTFVAAAQTCDLRSQTFVAIPLLLCALSALLLAALDCLRPRLAATTLRALADAALLTPLLCLPLQLLHPR